MSRGLALVAAAATAIAATAILGACAATSSGARRWRVDPITKIEQKCERGQLDECVELGLLYEAGTRPETDDDDDEDDADEKARRRRKKRPPPRVLDASPVRARALFERACAGGEGSGCYHLGRMRRDGAPADVAGAAAMFARGCELRDLEACTAHAFGLEHGIGVPADPLAGRTLMRAACDQGHPRACVNAGVVLYNEGIDEPRRRMAHELFGRACAEDDHLGCHYLARMEVEAATSRLELLRALDMHDEACHLGVGAACAAAGALYRDGFVVRGTEHDDDLEEYEYRQQERGARVREDDVYAVKLFERGCALGDRDACQGYFLALVDGEGVAQNVGKAARLAGEHCDAGHLASCQSLAYFYELGLGVKRDPARAEALYRQGCEAGTAGSCSNLAELLADRRDLEQAVVFARRGCELGDARGCNAGGVFIVTGAWPGDRAAGLEMLRRACELARSEDEVADYCAAATQIR